MVLNVKDLPPPSAPTSTFNVILIRHAESSNNVLADELESSYKMSPYTHGTEVWRAYQNRRSSDPSLSPLGFEQAEALPLHPHLQRIRILQLASQNRIKFYSSPMLRAMQTSLPLSKYLNMGVRIIPFICEFGGQYEFNKQLQQQQVAHGLKPSEILSQFPTYDVKYVHPDGWWKTKSKGHEERQYFEQRVSRTCNWIEQMCMKYSKNWKTSKMQDYAIVVCHADFIDSLLAKLLNIQQPGKYSFYHANTGVTHMEFEWKQKNLNEKQQDEHEQDEHEQEQDDDAHIHDGEAKVLDYSMDMEDAVEKTYHTFRNENMQILLRCVNSPPAFPVSGIPPS